MGGGRELLYNYEALLERLYRQVPAPASSGERFEMPRVQAIHVGSQTIIRNFKEIADRINRDPQLVTRYLLRELATAGSYDPSSGTLKINIKVTASSLNTLLERFVKTYVICPTCGRPDTRLLKRGKVFILKCDACGAEQPLKAF